MAKDIDYKTLRAELDKILANLDDPTLDVDQASKQYERGMQIIAELEAYLKTAENKIAKVKKKT